MSNPVEPEADLPVGGSGLPFIKLIEYAVKLLADGKQDIYRHVIHEVDRHLLHEVMKHFHGNQLQAADRLGISRMTLRSKLRSLGMLPNRNQESPNASAVSDNHPEP